MTPIEEAELHDRLLAALVSRGHDHVVFKPHPAAGAGHARRLRAKAAELGVHLTVVDETVTAEAWFRDSRPELVVSCFSTALLVAAKYFERPIATMGCATALERTTPYENSNRIPATIIDATVPELLPDGSLAMPPARDITALVRAVGFCMQPKRHPDLRRGAAEYLQVNGSARYFKRRRLEATGLSSTPGTGSLPTARIVQRVRRAVVRGPIREALSRI